jgi:ATP-binding cassette subfamily E protein 1
VISSLENILHFTNLAYRFILHAKKTAFIIEHDFIMATYLADRVIVFEGTPAIAATATPCVVVLFFISVEITKPN